MGEGSNISLEEALGSLAKAVALRKGSRGSTTAVAGCGGRDTRLRVAGILEWI